MHFKVFLSPKWNKKFVKNDEEEITFTGKKEEGINKLKDGKMAIENRRMEKQ